MCIMPEVSDWTAPVKVPSWTLPMKGKFSPHVSHDIYSFKDVLFCNVCGNVGSKQFRKLAKPCTGHANAYGNHNLDSFWRKSKLTSRISVPDQSFQHLVGGHVREQVSHSASSGQTFANVDTPRTEHEATPNSNVRVLHSFDDPEGGNG